MPVIDATDLIKHYGTHSILAGVSLTIRTGERVGLVGLNGSGKTTLGRIVAGVETADGGHIARRRDTRAAYLPQEPVLPAGNSVKQVVLDSLEEWSEVHRRHAELTETLAHAKGDEVLRLAELQSNAAETLEHLGGWDRDHEAETIVEHLGITDSERAVETLSGGEQRRVALARVLVSEPDIAILDEPTNHLDVATIEWLEMHLAERFRGALLLITHDRYLLDRVTTRTFDLEDGSLTSYAGGYAVYLEARAERQAHSERNERNRQNFLRREVEWLRRQPKARTGKQKARIGRVEDALAQKAPKKGKTADLRLVSERLGKTILELSDLRVVRGNRLCVDGLSLAIAAGQRIGLVGPNGVGKTSLLLTILGELEPTAGTLEVGANTRIGYLDQTRDELDETKSIREVVAGDMGEIDVGGYLERFLFDRRKQRVRVSELSGGERARVCLAQLLWQKTNLLLLDEPTNDLDVATLGALEAMLTDYAGSALIVSHDRWFLDRVATSILAFEGEGRVVLHAGNYSEYQARRALAEVAAAKGRNNPTDSRLAKTAGQKASSASRPKKLTLAKQRELDGLFERIERAEADAQRLEARLADPATYSTQGNEVPAIKGDLEAARTIVAELTERWETLEEEKAALGATE